MAETRTDAKLIYAPWSEEIVDALNAFQLRGDFHSFTCGKQSGHRDLVATPNGWICEDCDYTQNWAHEFMGRAVAETRTDALCPLCNQPMSPQSACALGCCPLLDGVPGAAETRTTQTLGSGTTRLRSVYNRTGRARNSFSPVRYWFVRLECWRVRYIAAAPPCWKGEIQIGPFLLGWQR